MDPDVIDLARWIQEQQRLPTMVEDQRLWAVLCGLRVRSKQGQTTAEEEQLLTSLYADWRNESLEEDDKASSAHITDDGAGDDVLE